MGDAAHALQSSSGQGVSQALEDAEMLGTLMARYLKSESYGRGDALQLAAKGYCQIRMPPVKRISNYSKGLEDMKRKKSIVSEWLMYFFM